MTLTQQCILAGVLAFLYPVVWLWGWICGVRRGTAMAREVLDQIPSNLSNENKHS